MKAMHSRKAIPITAALALAAGILFVPGGTLARPAGGSAVRGPVFGLHPSIAAHRPFRPAHIHRGPARFGWQLHRWHQHRFGGHNRGDVSAVYGGSVAPYPSDVTGTLPEGPAVYAPPIIPPPPSERIGCFSRGYEVPGELGGVAHVVVTRC